MNKKVKLTTFIVIVLFLSVGIFAQGMMGSQSMMKNKRGMMMMKSHSPMIIYKVAKLNQAELKITDNQLKKLKELAYSWEKQNLDFKSYVMNQRLKLKELMDTDKPNYNAIRSIMNKINTAKTDYFINGLKLKESVKSILSQQQIDSIKTMIKNRMKKRMSMMRGKAKAGRGMRK